MINGFVATPDVLDGPFRIAPARLDLAVGRALDVVLSIAGLVFLFPLLAAIATVMAATDPGPLLFAHKRIGRGGREFYCLKFRSMAVDADARLQALLSSDATARAEWERDHKLRHDPRITRIGRLLRSSSLDELPQLLNVIRGDMSLVGPRPIVRAEVGRYGRYFEDYCAARPGLTGLWQVSGRNAVRYRRRVAMDVLYVRRKNLLLDLGILFATIPAVLQRSGAY